MLVEIVEERMYRVARRSVVVVVEDEPVARIALDELARREMVLEADDHSEVPFVEDSYLLTVGAPSAVAPTNLKGSEHREKR